MAFLSTLVCMSSYQLCQCIWKYSRGEYRIERGRAGIEMRCDFFNLCYLDFVFLNYFLAFLALFIVPYSGYISRV